MHRGRCFVMFGCVMSPLAHVLETLVSSWWYYMRGCGFSRRWKLVEWSRSSVRVSLKVIVCPCLLPALCFLIQQDVEKQSQVSTGIAKNSLTHHALYTTMDSTPKEKLLIQWWGGENTHFSITIPEFIARTESCNQTQTNKSKINQLI